VRKTLEITTGRHPFQVAIVAACPLSSLIILITDRQPRSLNTALPDWFVNAWLIGFVVSGILALIGMHWRHPLGWGLMIECGGLGGLGAQTAVYSASLALVNGLDALGTGGLVTAIATACWWRAGQIIRDIRRLRHAQARPVIATRLVLTEETGTDQDPR
jgi:hypothetical protein